jgi:hypothetical protein
MTTISKRRSRAPREFHLFEELSVDLQVMIIEQAFRNDFEVLNLPHLPNDLSQARKLQGLHIAVTGNAFEVVRVSARRYNTLGYEKVPKVAPYSAPRLFSLYAVNNFFRKELDRLSGGRLFFAFQPDFQWRDHMDVVYFDPLRMVLKIHLLDGQPDARKIAGFINKRLASRATMVQVLVSYEVLSLEDLPWGRAYRGFNDRNHYVPKLWIHQLLHLFRRARVASIAWWSIGVLWARTNLPDDDGVTRPRVFR